MQRFCITSSEEAQPFTHARVGPVHVAPDVAPWPVVSVPAEALEVLEGPPVLELTAVAVVEFPPAPLTLADDSVLRPAVTGSLAR